MNTTTTTTQNRSLFNGFLPITEYPENLQGFIAKLRTENPSVNIEYKTKNNIIELDIFYTTSGALKSAMVFKLLIDTEHLTNRFHLKRFAHYNDKQTSIRLTTKNKA